MSHASSGEHMLTKISSTDLGIAVSIHHHKFQQTFIGSFSRSAEIIQTSTDHLVMLLPLVGDDGYGRIYTESFITSGEFYEGAIEHETGCPDFYLHSGKFTTQNDWNIIASTVINPTPLTIVDIAQDAEGVQITPNFKPYFVTWQGSVEYSKKSGTQIYTLPDIEDPEGSEVKVEVVLGSTQDFCNYLESANWLVFNLDAPAAAVGDYRIDITLNDGRQDVLYQLYVMIDENLAPYFLAVLVIIIIIIGICVATLFVYKKK